MDDQTKAALNAFVRQMIDAAQVGASWTAEQAPLLVQEWLRWMFWSSALQAVGAGIVLVALPIVYLKFMRWCFPWDKANGGDGSLTFVIGVPAVIGAIMCEVTCGTFFVVNVLMALKVAVAPRVAVIEQFISLVK